MTDPVLAPPATAGHPLAATFQRGYGRVHRGCHLGARLAVAPDATSVGLHDLVGNRLDLDALLDGVGDDVGSARRDVQASLFLEAYAWTLLLPLAGALLLESRVPVLGADRVAVTLRSGFWPDELALRAPAFAVLAGDPDSRHPDALVAESEPALVAILREQLVGHLRSPVEALAAHSGRPERALWRSVADRAAAALLFASETAGDVPRGTRLATALLGGPAPLLGRPDYRDLPGPDGLLRAHVRTGCCLWWRTQAATCCLTCPRSVADESRRAAERDDVEPAGRFARGSSRPSVRPSAD